MVAQWLALTLAAARASASNAPATCDSAPSIGEPGRFMSPALLQVRRSPSRAHAQDTGVSDGAQLVTVFSVECKSYHEWQTVTLHSSWRRANVPGKLVRLLACPEALRAQSLDLSGLAGMETHVHEVADSFYPPLNKPFGLMTWLNDGGGRDMPGDTVVMIVDCDMVFYGGGKVLEAITPLVERVQSGAALALGNDEVYTVKGLQAQNWTMARHFNVSNVERLQSIAVPILLRKDTLAEFVSRYYGITRDIVRDSSLLALVHDGNQLAPWIAEMVGYTLATERVAHETQRQWPALESAQPPWGAGTQAPLFVHYAHTFRLCGRVFGKSLYHSLDLLRCTTNATQLAVLQPPSQAEANENSCQLCVQNGDAYGVPATCHLEGGGKAVGLYAWEQVHEAVSSWRSIHCA